MPKASAACQPSATAALFSGRSPAAVETPVILVIEDEEMVLLGYSMLFESWGYQVLAASSAEEALALLSPIQDDGAIPNAIVADYRLRRGATGLSAIRQVQEVCDHLVPAILITGETSVERLREVADSGVPVLHKPINPHQLSSLLRGILGD